MSRRYSLAGIATSCLVGLAIAGLGTLAAFTVPAVVLSIVAAVVALAMMLREAGIVRFDPPQCDVQTHKEWVYEFGLTTATGMWGAHIGLALTTVITHGGLYALVLAAFARGLGGGEWIIVAFWVGRVLPLWLAPVLSGRLTRGDVIAGRLRQATSSFGVVSICGLGVVATLCVVESWMALAAR